MDRLDRRTRNILLLIVVLGAITVQLPLMLRVRVLEYDEAIFLDVARNIQRTGIPVRSIGEKGAFYFEHPPLYVYGLSLYAKSSSIGILFARLVTTFIGLGSILVTFSIGAQIGGTRAGLVSALLLAINSFFALYSFYIYMEVPMAFSIMVGIRLILEAEKREQDNLLALAGLALAVAVLFKEFALVFTLVCAAYVLLSRWRNGRPGWRAAFKVAAPTVIGLLLWAIWCWRLSPEAFSAAMQRWINSAAVGGLDARMLTSTREWANQIVFDLLGAGIVTGLAIAAGWIMIRRRPMEPIQFLFWGYLIAAIGLSFFTRLKELRHLIGVIPVSALLVGTSIDWELLWRGSRGGWLRKSLGALAAVLVLSAASPLRVPCGDSSRLSAWLAPLYAQRVFNNDPYYNAIRLAAIYVQSHTEPQEIITVVHEGPVLGYYADRHYNMLYVLPEQSVLQALEGTNYLVWDHTVFPALRDEQIKAVQSYVEQHFSAEQIIQDRYRHVTVYRQKNSP